MDFSSRVIFSCLEVSFKKKSRMLFTNRFYVCFKNLCQTPQNYFYKAFLFSYGKILDVQNIKQNENKIRKKHTQFIFVELNHVLMDNPSNLAGFPLSEYCLLMQLHQARLQ